MFGPFDDRLRLAELSEAEVLALAVSAEEEDGRIYRRFAAALAATAPATAALCRRLAEEEDVHRRDLLAAFEMRFGGEMPPIRREDVRDFPRRRRSWRLRGLTAARVRAEIEGMERAAAAFYGAAAAQARDPGVRRLLGDLAAVEEGHRERAAAAAAALDVETAGREAAEERRAFLLTYVQPGLAGLIDGSISTLAPVFAAAFATRSSHETLLVGLAASVGAGISMGFTEALSDDGRLTGRGSPLTRGLVTGLMTTLGGLGHALPYLLWDFWLATAVALGVAGLEIVLIAWIRWRFMESPFWRALLHVSLGGALVVAAGVLIGSG
jgi:rubrerythrin